MLRATKKSSSNKDWYSFKGVWEQGYNLVMKSMKQNSHSVPNFFNE